MRPDGRLLVALAAHDGAILSIYIATNPEDVSSFAPEIQIHADPGAGFCYPNLMWLSAEGDSGRLYCFIRGLETLPTYLYSDDWGKIWTHTRVFFHSTDSTPKPTASMPATVKTRSTWLSSAAIDRPVIPHII